MRRHLGTSPLPAIIVGEQEYEKLSAMAAAAVRSMPDVAESLLFELDRATVVGMEEVPAGIVRLGSKVSYRPDEGAVRDITLVLPSEADISAGKVSVLTPIGTALIGLCEGQLITWSARDGKQHRLEVIAVEQPAPEG